MNGTLNVHIRWMIRSDMPRVLEIENSSFEFPYDEADFTNLLRRCNVIGMVAESVDEVLGYVIYELHRNRIYVPVFAVCPGHRRRGVGSSMVRKLLGKLSPDRRTSISVEVRETNLEAQTFFRSQGFRAISVVRAPYEETDEDAYLMEYRLGPGGVGGGYCPANRISGGILGENHGL